MPKTCSKCRESLSTNEVCKNRTKADGLHTECRACAKAYQRTRKQRSPDYYREKKWLQLYGLSSEAFKSLEAGQNGACAVCRRPNGRTLCVDHCHKTGKIRGLLCDNCNRAIGLFVDDPTLMRQAAVYVEAAYV